MAEYINRYGPFWHWLTAPVVDDVPMAMMDDKPAGDYYYPDVLFAGANIPAKTPSWLPSCHPWVVGSARMMYSSLAGELGARFGLRCHFRSLHPFTH